MEVIYGADKITNSEPAVVTVGTFDGVHLGHIKIIEQVLDEANKKGLISTLVTFDPHPKTVIQSPQKNKVSLLSNIEEKIELLNKTGIEKVLIIKFTREFSEIQFAAFVDNYLLNFQLRYAHVLPEFVRPFLSSAHGLPCQ